jgi:hypothetical protein
MGNERRFGVIDGVKPLIQAATQTARSHLLVFMGALQASDGGIGSPIGKGHIEFSPWRTNAS